MVDQKTLLSLLQVTVPPATPLTVLSEVKILEILGIVSSETSVKALDVAVDLVPPGTPATLQGLVQLLSNLAKSHPDCPKSTHSKLDDLLTKLKSTPDAALSYGTFLAICSTWISDTSKKDPHKGEKRRSAA